MTQEELEILNKALTWADGYFTNYCEFADVCVYEQDEIDAMDDEIEQEEAQENKDYNDLLLKAQNIVEKYLKKGGKSDV